ncbi:MAG: ABC transporter permease, partial [Candidatus Sericytochromatia bacterium]|nr:ABC transporter permease [Candidatus Sericytochromatia bacterium]
GVEELGGTRFVMVMSERPRLAWRKQDHWVRGLTVGDRDAIRAALPDATSLLATTHFYSVPVAAEGRPAATVSVLATEPAYFEAYRLRLSAGRPLTEADLASRARVVVLGDGLRARLFPEGRAVGQEVHLRGQRLRVVGVLAPNQKGDSINLGYDWEKVAVMPLTAPGVGSQLERISLCVRRTEDGERAVRVINSVLLHRHHGVDDFQIFDFGGLLKNFYLAFSAMKLLVAAIASIALLVGGIGVMNIMLVAVRERRREIGLRLALGASRRQVREQFLVEAVLLTSLGAGGGVLLGVAVALGGSWAIHAANPAWITLVSPGAALLALVASLAIGVAFGWYPAARAAAEDPIRCLRQD